MTDITTAASLSRLLRHFQGDAHETGIAILTADRGDRSDNPQHNAALNQQARRKLQALLQRHGLRGWINVKDGYVEDKETGVAVYEHSLFVPYVPRALAVKLARQLGEAADINDEPLEVKRQPAYRLAREQGFRQDAILWGNASDGAWLFFHNGNKERIGQRFVPQQLGQFFTEWQGRRFSVAGAFSTLEYIPTGPDDYRQWRRHLADAELRYLGRAMNNIEKRLAAAQQMRPKQGFNVVAVDSYEAPGEELYLIAHVDTREEADALAEAYAGESGDKTYVYGPAE